MTGKEERPQQQTSLKKEKKEMKSESFDKTFRANKHCMALHLD